MMDVANIFKINTDYNDSRSSPSWEEFISAEVVFIDKSNEHVSGMLYRLKKGSWDSEPHPNGNASSFSLSMDDIILLGQIASIDRQKKTVILLNNITVSYQYLIWTSGVKPFSVSREWEFSIGMQALNDALRVRPKIPSSFAFTIDYPIACQKDSHQKLHIQDQSGLKNYSLHTVVEPSMTLAKEGAISKGTAFSRSLFQIEI